MPTKTSNQRQIFHFSFVAEAPRNKHVNQIKPSFIFLLL